MVAACRDFLRKHAPRGPGQRHGFGFKRFYQIQHFLERLGDRNHARPSNLPDFPPSLLTSRTSPISIDRSTDFSMS